VTAGLAGTASTRSERLLSAAAQAAELRGYQTDPDVVALRVERVRAQVEAMAWTGIVLGLAFTMANVQALASQGLEAGSLGWWAAWLLDPMVSLVLLALLRAEQITSRYRVQLGPWVPRARRACLAATYAMNTWSAWAVLDGRLIVLHSVPPLLVWVASEAIAQARVGLTDAVDVAQHEARDRVALAAEPAAIGPQSDGQLVESADGRDRSELSADQPEQASDQVRTGRVSDAEVRAEMLARPDGPPTVKDLRAQYGMGWDRATRLVREVEQQLREQSTHVEMEEVRR
jgi:hypothetical protein